MRFSANTVSSVLAVGAALAFITDHGLPGFLLLIATLMTVD